MELRQLRYVLAVAETRNFTRAAEQCYVVQSALSHQIKALEDELGVRLFARTSRRVELTAAGEAFLPAARASLEAAERAAADAAAAVGELRGRVALGIVPTVTALDIPRALRTFHRAHPAVRVTLRTAGSDELISAVEDGTVDLAVLGLPENSAPTGIRTLELARARLVAVVSPEHHLSGRRRLRLADLSGETFADFPAGTPGRAQSDLAFEAAGIQRDVTFESMSPALILDLVGQNLAVALLPPAILSPDAPTAAIPVTDGPTRIEYLAWSDFNPAPAATALLSVLRAPAA
ncbi:DNA-binding transcriptional LysR family regulator [Streptomyces sp. 840.1]|uniref:LysR family transcriptional regulator n=1 Tax=Streptomyces sp. 840.1 TaxID=2485152 RepID=UPI000F49EFDD|nr:LysR family transcriptional regulator [Streptomyces sp. 840.1]ROQ69091.1 DNA-binding transcriptional LysR family regulator [Streptomyces sp. 840.1]